ncbi:MAG: hypothetical protein ACOCWA_04275 [Bacteroidota bacterium]
MKRIVLFLFFISFSFFSYSQVFNTGRLLKPGIFSLGVNPVVVDEGLENDIRVNIYGGYGLSQYVDVSFRYQLMENKDYFGADFEFAVYKTKKVDVSLIAGGHARYDIGLDGTVCVSFPLNYYLTVFTGLDADLELDEDQAQPYVWLPLGAEIKWTRKISALIEVDFPMSNFAWNILSVGLEFYL